MSDPNDPDWLKKVVGSKAKELRKRAGFKNAEDAAAQVGFSSNSIYELERGENWISQEMLTRLSVTYQAQPSEFFPGSTDPKLELLELIPKLNKHAAASILTTVRALVLSSEKKNKSGPS